MIVSCVHINEMIGNRFDPMFYNPLYTNIIRTIKNVHYKTLGEIAVFSSESWNQKSYFNYIFPYIEISAIDILTGEVKEIDQVPIHNAPIRAKKIVRKDDIIISTTRPNRGAISLIEENLCIASTGFAVIRDISACIIRKYLYIVLRIDCILEQMAQRSAGGNYPAITECELKKILLPVPPIHIQENIIDIYTKAQEAKQAKDEEAKSLLSSIDSFVLKEMGISLPTKDTYTTENIVSLSQLVGNRYDPYYHNEYFEEAFKCLKETSNYRLVRLSDISILITSGITPKSGGDDYTDSEHGVAFIRSGNIDIMGEVDFDNLLYIKREVHETRMKSSKVQEGDIMIAIVGATIGQVGIYHSSREANINQAIALVRLKDGYNSEYIKEVIKSSIGQLNLDRLKRPVARANINLEEISSMLIPVPEIEIQNDIVKSIVSIRRKAKQLQKEGVGLLETTKQEIEKIILGL